MPQRPDLFYCTIADNLRLAKPEATDVELWEAIEGAALGVWARSLEHDLATSIGELGDSLSGGQRQRLAIARALLRDAPVLVLDEATSELDLETERARLVSRRVRSLRGTPLKHVNFRSDHPPSGHPEWCHAALGYVTFGTRRLVEALIVSCGPTW